MDILRQPIMELIAERDELRLQVELYRAESLAWHARYIQLQEMLCHDTTIGNNPIVNEED